MNLNSELNKNGGPGQKSVIDIVIEHERVIKELIQETEVWGAKKDKEMVELINQYLEANNRAERTTTVAFQGWRSRHGYINIKKNRKSTKSNTPKPSVLNFKGIIENYGIKLKDGEFEVIDNGKYFVGKNQGEIVLGLIQARGKLRVDIY